MSLPNGTVPNTRPYEIKFKVQKNQSNNIHAARLNILSAFMEINEIKNKNIAVHDLGPVTSAVLRYI